MYHHQGHGGHGGVVDDDSHVATFDTMVNLQLNIACLIIFAKMIPEDFRYVNISNGFS